MRSMGLQGVIRGKPVKTTISDKAAPCPLDHVNRQFRAPRPNALWVSDFTYVATWTGFVDVAFVIDAYARRIVGCCLGRVARSRGVDRRARDDALAACRRASVTLTPPVERIAKAMRAILLSATTSGPADPIVRAQGRRHDRTHDQRSPQKRPLISGRHPDMTMPSQTSFNWYRAIRPTEITCHDRRLR